MLNFIHASLLLTRDGYLTFWQNWRTLWQTVNTMIYRCSYWYIERHFTEKTNKKLSWIMLKSDGFYYLKILMWNIMFSFCSFLTSKIVQHAFYFGSWWLYCMLSKRERGRENTMCDFDIHCEDRTRRGDSYIASLTCGDEICIFIRINTCQQCHLQ